MTKKPNVFAPRQRKLTDDQVRAIRLDERKLYEIAAAYGISETAAAAIRARTRKAHVAD